MPITDTSAVPRRIALWLAVLLWMAGSALLIQTELARAAPDWVVVCTTPLIWAVVMLLPVLAHHALHANRWVAAALLAAAGLIGTAYTLNGTIGRQAEARETKALEASASGESRSLLQGELTRTQMQLGLASKAAADACRTKAWTDNCKNLQSREKAYAARADNLIAEIAKAAPAKPKDSGTNKVTMALSLLSGKPKAEIEPWVATFGDALLGLTIELGALSLLYFGLEPGRAGPSRVPATSPPPSGGRLRDATPALAAPVGTPLIAEPAPESVAAPPLPLGARLDADTLAVLMALKDADAPLTNEQVREAMGLASKGEASRRVSNAVASGLVKREREGREVRISLADAAAVH